MTAYPPESWRTFFPLLEAWQGLALEHRRAILASRSGIHQLPPILLALPHYRLSPFFDADGKGGHRLSAEGRRLQALVQRLSGWSRAQGPDLAGFVQGMTTHDQRRALTGMGIGAAPDLMTAAMARQLSTGRLTRLLLEKQTADDFLAAVGAWHPPGLPLTPPRFAALRSWVEGNLKRKRTGFLLSEETFRLPRSPVPPEELVALLIAYGLVFPGVLPDTLDPVVQILVPVDAAPQGPERLELRPHAPVETYLRPFLLDDMDACLRALKAEPLPLLSDGLSAPMARLRRLGKQFPPLPAWVPEEGFTPEQRALAAWWMLVQLNLFSTSGRSARTYQAQLNPQGQDWLALPREKQLARLLDEAPLGRREAHRLGERFSFLGDHAVHPFPYAALTGEVIDSLDETSARLTEQFELDALLESAAHAANPFRAAMARDALLEGRWARWEEEPEMVYARLLLHHVARLASLGAVALSRDREGRLGVTLSGVGRWLYGEAEAWTLPGEARAVAVVGADFHITFLEADAGLAADLAAFAEPIGTPGAAGAAFRLTRTSVQAGAHRGLDVEAMLATLARGSRTPVPPNVIHEVKHWARGKRTVTLIACILVEGEDPVALAELKGDFPKDFEAVSPKALRYTGTLTPAALAKRLAKKGFFAA